MMEPKELADRISVAVNSSGTVDDLLMSARIVTYALYPMALTTVEGCRLYRRLIHPPDQQADVEKTDCYGQFYMNTLRATILGMAFQMSRHQKPHIHEKARSATQSVETEEELAAVRAAGMAGNMSDLIKHRFLYQDAFVRLDWENNQTAKKTVAELIAHHDGASLPLNLTLTGLLTGLPAEEFRTLDGLPHHMLDSILEATLHPKPVRVNR